MSKQWMLAGGIVVALAVGGWTLTHAGSGGVVGVDSPAPDFRAVEVATHACAPSRAARRSWNMRTVGLVKRE